jgi:hypothetical protein
MEVASEPSWRTAVMSSFMSCRLHESPATRAKAPALRAHMVGTGLGCALGSARQVLWAGASKCYSVSGVNAHLTALDLMLLASSMAVLDRVFIHGLRMACPQAVPAFPSGGRPPQRRRRPFVTALAEFPRDAELHNP